MFVPDEFRTDTRQRELEIIRANPLALLVSAGPDGILATHLPIVLEHDADEETAGPPAVLGHMNRRNPHWTALATNGQALLVFNGPQGYVSPAVYGPVDFAAPTWNFTVVHVRGVPQPLTQGEQTRHVVRSTARLLEARFGRGWDMTSSQEYFERLLPGVGAFRMPIDSVQSMFKLSQDQPAAVRHRVVDAYARGDLGSVGDLAGLMCAFGRPTAERTAN